MGSDEAGAAGDQDVLELIHASEAPVSETFDVVSEQAFQIDEYAFVIAHQGFEIGFFEGAIGRVIYGNDHGVVAIGFWFAYEVEVVFVLYLSGIGHRVDDIHGDVVALQLSDHINHLGVADVGHVLLEGEAHDQNARFERILAEFEHAFDGLFANVCAHGVIDIPPGIDDPRMVSQFA